MKCSECNHFVTDVYNGCDWCNMPPIAKQTIRMLDREIELEQTKTQLSKDDNRLYIEQLAQARINVINNAKQRA